MRRILLFILFSSFVLGCGSSEDAGPAKPTATEQRDQAIVDRSGGNWDALSAEDKKTLLDDLGGGNEQTARMTFSARTSKGGPPTPGRPN